MPDPDARRLGFVDSQSSRELDRAIETRQSESIAKLRDAVAKAKRAAEGFIQAWREHERRHPYPHVDDRRRPNA